MDTKTLAANLRQAIAGCGDYHIERWGRELADRAEELQRALDALKKRQDAARGAILDGRDTEPATGETARETELQDFKQENDWLAGEWVRLLHALGIEDAWRVLDRDDELVDPPATVALNAITPKPTPAMEENPERDVIRTCINCRWYVADRRRYEQGWDGDCRRYPEWSARNDSDWCGEWVAR